ncbi:hypothetical protein B6U91_02285 [Candidatus Pacearchaeota archaeon ex4484_71]|nr:MAG: hypothetical protein B6U91_02285 [Candidatus Pacearchaeota archaeon ex4484_71]
MKIKISKEKIELKKGMNNLDKLVLNFTKILEKLDIKYVLVSGYISILFGRSRSSEDIDIIVERMDKSLFNKFWNRVNKKFESIITKNKSSAYRYLLTGHTLRFARKNEFIPNIEMKFPKTELDEWTIENRKKVLLNKNIMHISPIELQIAFKLFLGSEKDLEDAKYLYNIFENDIEVSLLNEFMKKLKVRDKFKRYIK